MHKEILKINNISVSILCYSVACIGMLYLNNFFFCYVTSSRIRTAGAAMLPILAMVETKPIPVCLQEMYMIRKRCRLACTGQHIHTFYYVATAHYRFFFKSTKKNKTNKT